MDAKGGQIAVHGWQETAGDYLVWAKRFEELGAGSLLYTNVDVEGLQQGVRFEPVKRLIDHVGIPVVVAGGVSARSDVAGLKDAGAFGAVLGSALYSGKISSERCTGGMSMRVVEVKRATKETKIVIRINPDGKGDVNVESGVPFFDHMLTAMAKHGGFDLTCTAQGRSACGLPPYHRGYRDRSWRCNKTGHRRGSRVSRGFPMPSSRWMNPLPRLHWTAGAGDTLSTTGTFGSKSIGTIPSDIFEHFFYSLCTRAGITAHITFSGKNDHHKCEAAFKAFGIALGQALAITGDKETVRSTKGKF